MSEAKARRTEWPDVDRDTFVRLCEYAYTHDYTPPSPAQVPHDILASAYAAEYAAEPDSVPVEVGSGEVATEAEEWFMDGERRVEFRVLPYREKHVRTHYLRKMFSNLSILPPLNSKHLSDLGPMVNNGPYQDFTPVFEGHAKLYILADKWGIKPLCRLVLYQLHRTLTDFKLYQRGVDDVINLAQIAYNDDFKGAAGIHALRDLVIRYIVSVMGQIGDDERFMGLLSDGGDFVVDFWRMVWVAN